MAEIPQIVRHWSILRCLSTRRLGASIDEIAADSGVSRRTIQRDLVKLQTLAFPITVETGPHGLKRWKLTADEGLINLKFTLEEAAALALGRQFLEPLAGTHFHAGAISALKKIRSTLSESALRHIEKLAHGFYHAVRGWTDYGHKAELIDSLVTAIEDRQVTAIGYHSLRSTEEVSLYDLYPLSLVYWKGALYLIADSPGHAGIRTFKVDRIRSVEVLKLPFAVPIPFDPEEYLRHSFGIFQSDAPPQTVRILFRSDAGRLLEERQFHPTQKVRRRRDGRWLVEFDLSSFEELQSWVMSWGAAAEVLEPEGFRERVSAALQDAARAYQKTSTVPGRRVTSPR